MYIDGCAMYISTEYCKSVLSYSTLTQTQCTLCVEGGRRGGGVDAIE